METATAPKWHAYIANTYFQILLYYYDRWTTQSSIMEIYKHICKKYNVYNFVASDIEKGAYVSMTEWKSLVQKAIWDKAIKCYKASYSIYANLSSI